LPEITAESKSEYYLKQFFNKCELNQDFSTCIWSSAADIFMWQERDTLHPCTQTYYTGSVSIQEMSL